MRAQDVFLADEVTGLLNASKPHDRLDREAVALNDVLTLRALLRRVGLKSGLAHRFIDEPERGAILPG